MSETKFFEEYIPDTIFVGFPEKKCPYNYRCAWFGYGPCPQCGILKSEIDRKLSDTKPTNHKDRAATTRLDISVFPDTAVAYGALAMTEGDYKYGAYNYRVAGVLASVYYSACRRHLGKWFNGEDTDPKTGVHHLANALACIAVLIDAIEANKLKDDRPPRVDLAGLLTRMEEDVARLQKLFPDGPGRYTEVEHGNQA